ncbi:Putative peroxiredoxin bcp [Methylophilaceae bacterium]|nr:Putative peroxiredoxin bcp [Methylophilaceae bacterium]
MLQIGDLAPDFSMPDADMEMFKLSRLRGRTIVLYFYPKDDTPGCTVEAIEFSDLEEEFSKLNAVVIGVSKDDCITHASFRDKHGLSIQLVSDEEGKVCEKYGVWQEKEKDGVRKMGILRSTFVIDTEGKIRYCQYGVVAKGHAHEVLNLIKSF